jgi:hypothetical protein
MKNILVMFGLACLLISCPSNPVPNSYSATGTWAFVFTFTAEGVSNTLNGSCLITDSAGTLNGSCTFPDRPVNTLTGSRNTSDNTATFGLTAASTFNVIGKFNGNGFAGTGAQGMLNGSVNMTR